MFKEALIICALFISGCGYSSMNNELTGQVKKVVAQTPIFCPRRTDVDVSLGVMRNGVGSMSHEDAFGTVTDPEAIGLLRQAAETGAIVKITYNMARIRFCEENREITKVELVP